MRGSEIWNARLTAAHTIARELDAINAYQAGNRLGSIEVPVRMLLGAETTEFLRTATRAFAAGVPGTDLVELPGQAHQAIDFAPDQIIRLLFEFD